MYDAGPNDLSMMSSYQSFVAKYRRIIANTASLLRPKRLAIFVVGELRDKKTHAQLGFHHDTVSAFKDAGCSMHQDAILLTATGTAAMRATRTMGAGSKLVPTHQNVVVCVKGTGFTPADARAAGIRANSDSQ